jgi:hypothetical protein
MSRIQSEFQKNTRLTITKTLRADYFAGRLDTKLLTLSTPHIYQRTDQNAQNND